MPSAAAKNAARREAAVALMLILRNVPAGAGLHFRFADKVGGGLGGLPAAVWGERASALRCVEENVRRLSAASPERIVFPCGSCLLMFGRNMLSFLPKDHPLSAHAARLG